MWYVGSIWPTTIVTKPLDPQPNNKFVLAWDYWWILFMCIPWKQPLHYLFMPQNNNLNWKMYVNDWIRVNYSLSQIGLRRMGGVPSKCLVSKKANDKSKKYKTEENRKAIWADHVVQYVVQHVVWDNKIFYKTRNEKTNKNYSNRVNWIYSAWNIVWFFSTRSVPFFQHISVFLFYWNWNDWNVSRNRNKVFTLYIKI